MSRIYFHDEHSGGAELRGSERAYAGGICSDLFAMALGLDDMLLDRDLTKYLRLFAADYYLHRSPLRLSTIRTALTVGREFFEPQLNTALVMGSDAVKLLARLHGACEIHAYVEGADRAWLAEIIDKGRSDKLLRADMGWESVAALLRVADDAPIVTSYSVCDQFPSPSAVDWKGDTDEWYELPRDDRWRQGLAAIRARRGLRIEPEGWATFWFESGDTAFDLLERISEQPAAGSPQ